MATREPLAVVQIAEMWLRLYCLEVCLVDARREALTAEARLAEAVSEASAEVVSAEAVPVAVGNEYYI